MIFDKSSCLREEKVERKERQKCQVHDSGLVQYGQKLGLRYVAATLHRLNEAWNNKLSPDKVKASHSQERAGQYGEGTLVEWEP